MIALKKIKSHSDGYNILKGSRFITNTLNNQRLNAEKTLICFLNFLFMNN